MSDCNAGEACIGALSVLAVCVQIWVEKQKGHAFTWSLSLRLH